jgi:hypothetical protein
VRRRWWTSFLSFRWPIFSFLYSLPGTFIYDFIAMHNLLNEVFKFIGYNEGFHCLKCVKWKPRGAGANDETYADTMSGAVYNVSSCRHLVSQSRFFCCWD